MPFLRVIHHERNLGYGAALISGFKNAKKDLIFYTDGDGQYDVREMHNLLAQLKPNIDLVNGYKVKRADAWYRVVIGATYRQAMRWIFRLSIRDVDCDFRLFRRHVFDTISLESRSGVICVEMAKKFEHAGFRMAEIPVSHYPRMHGRSEFFRVRHVAYTFKGLLSLVDAGHFAQITPMDEYRGEKVLITGGLGFIGSNLAIRLVEAGASVTILDSMHPTCGGKLLQYRHPFKKDLEIVEGDAAIFNFCESWFSASATSSI